MLKSVKQIIEYKVCSPANTALYDKIDCNTIQQIFFNIDIRDSEDIRDLPLIIKTALKDNLIV